MESHRLVSLKSLIDQLNDRFERWSFVGSIVDWYYLPNRVKFKDIDVITDHPFIATYAKNDPLFGERCGFRWQKRPVEVFRGEPFESMFQPKEHRIAYLKELVAKAPNQQKYRISLERYAVPVKQALTAKSTSYPCPYRGDQVRTITSVVCKKKTIDLPVYSCGLYGGECVHRQVCHDHDPAIRICVGCPRE